MIALSSSLRSASFSADGRGLLAFASLARICCVLRAPLTREQNRPMNQNWLARRLILSDVSFVKVANLTFSAQTSMSLTR